MGEEPDKQQVFHEKNPKMQLNLDLKTAVKILKCSNDQTYYFLRQIFHLL
jgi:hypothetical protein